MKVATYHLETLTPCFCGGADPKTKAEIRAPSIRGQMRWWFRTLGGFQALVPADVRHQEDLVFGSIRGAGDRGQAGKLVLRVEEPKGQSSVKDGQDLGHRNFSDSAYLTFPIQSRERQGQRPEPARRGVLVGASFGLQVIWKGPLHLWDDIKALVTVFGHLGSLGFRSRRAMGALAFSGQSPGIHEALQRFANPGSIRVRTLGPCDADQVVPALGRWLRHWRAHGRTGNNATEQGFDGFRWAKSDHDQGVARLSRRNPSAPVYRAALGLPIVQYFSSSRGTVQWEAGPKGNKGRFASPILLRPYRDESGRWHPLVIFANAHRWPDGRRAYLNEAPCDVSLELYEAMTADPNLRPLFSGGRP